MTFLKPRSTLSRLLALGLLASMFALLAAGVLLPLLDMYRAQTAEIDQLKDLKAQYLARQTDLEALRDALDRLEADGTAGAAYLDAANETLAVTRIQSAVRALTEASGALLASTQALERTGEGQTGPHVPVVVRVEIRASLDQVRTLLHALEGGQPYLFVDAMTVIAPRSGDASAGARHPLTLRFNVTGYLRPEGRA